MTESKNYFEQKVPDFIDRQENSPVEFEFYDTEELLNHKYIQKWLKTPNSKLLKRGVELIIKIETGKNFVIGTVRNSDSLDIEEYNSEG